MRKLLRFALSLAVLLGLATTSMAADQITYNSAKYNVVGDNLFTNGSFEDGVNGWFTVGYTTAADASNFTLTSTGGYDGGAYITTSAAGAGAATSIRQAIAVTAGKTYYFCVYTNGTAPGSSNYNYNALFQMTDATTENGVLKAFTYGDGTTWNKCEFVFTADDSHPYVGVRMSWNSNSSWDGFQLYEIEEAGIDLSALTAEITTAQTLLATYTEGTDWYTSLSAAIATAQAATPTTAEEAAAAVTALQTAESEAAAAYKKSLYATIADGTYYIKNVESGYFLSNGAYWGTRSVLFGEGLTYDVTCGTDGKYTLASGIKSATNALRPSDGYNDQSGTWEIYPNPNGEGVLLYNGSQYFCNDASGIPGFSTEATDGCVWEFVTADERKAALSEASATNPVDATVYITAADFHNSDVDNAAWDGYKVGGDNGSGSTLLNNANSEKWNAGTYVVSQTISGLPNGIYALSAQAFYRHGGTGTTSTDAYENGTEVSPVLFANTDSVAIKSVYAEAPTDAANGGWATASASTAGTTYYIPNTQGQAAACFNAGAYVNTIDSIEVTDGTMKIGIARTGDAIQDWTVFDSFRLTYYGEKVEPSVLVSTLTAIPTSGYVLSGNFKATFEEYNDKVIIKGFDGKEGDDLTLEWDDNGWTTINGEASPWVYVDDATYYGAYLYATDGYTGGSWTENGGEFYMGGWFYDADNNSVWGYIDYTLVKDYTASIANADLSTTDAWDTTNTKGISDGAVKVGSGNTFDFSQTITLPAGKYQMTANAAYRYSGSETDEYTAIAAGTETHYAKIYATTATYDYVGNVKNRYEGATDAALDGTTSCVEVNGKYVPNSSADVVTYMVAGQYANDLVFNVQEEGQVKIGIRKTENPEAGDYTNIGTWTLYRLGDAEADPTPATEDIDIAGTWYENTTGMYYGSDWEDFSLTNNEVTITVDGTTATFAGLIGDDTNTLTATIDTDAKTLTFASGQTIAYGGYDWEMGAEDSEGAEGDLVGTISEDGKTITLDGLNIWYDGYSYMYNTQISLTREKAEVPVVEDPYAPVLPEGYVLNVSSEVAATMTAATGAEDNDHWYVITQVRGGESMMYDNGTSTMKRGSTAETAESIDGKAIADNVKYLVRFIPTGVEGVYNMQFANGDYIQTSLTTGAYATAGTYFFYNIGGAEGNYGWNLTTDSVTYGSRVDNNAAGNTLAFWDSGEVTSTGGNNDWYIYSVTFEEAKPAVELAVSATAVTTGTEITLTATATAFDAEPAISYYYSYNGGEAVAMYSNTITPDAAGTYVFTATAVLDATIATSKEVTVSVISGEYAGSYYLKNNENGLYATYGKGYYDTTANVDSTGTQVNISVVNGAYNLKFEGQNKWIGQNSWDNQCYADGPQAAYTIEEADGGYIIMQGSKYLTYAYDSEYSVNNLVWGTTPTTWTLLTPEQYAAENDTVFDYTYEAYVGSSYEGAVLDVNTANILKAIGATSMDNVTVYSEEPDGTRTASVRGTTDGWRNAEGTFTTWGDAAYFYVQDEATLPGAEYYLGAYPGKTDSPVSFTAKLVYVNNDTQAEKAITITLNYVEAPEVVLTAVDSVETSVAYTFSGKGVDAEGNEVSVTGDGSYTEKVASLTDEQVSQICTALGITALSEATVYGYNPSTAEFLASYAAYDGWRAANGDFHKWDGGAEAPVCVKYDNGKDYYCYNIEGCWQTVACYWAIANADGQAVLVKINFTYTDVPTAINSIAAETQNRVIYNVAGQRLNKTVKGINIINGKKVLVK